MRKTDIIIYSMFRTDNAYSSISLRLAKVWARTNRVFYVNHPYSLFDIKKEFSDIRAKGRLGGLLRFSTQFEVIEGDHLPIVTVIPPPTMPINWLPEGSLYNRASAANNRAVLNAIKKTIATYDIKNYVFFNCFDPFFAGYLPRPEFKPLLSIYDCIDDISQDPYTARHGVRLEAEAVRNSDVTVCTSRQLRKKYEPMAKHVHQMYNAAEIHTLQLALKKTFEKPDEIANRSGKVIGFVGNLDHLRIDYPLLVKVARHFKEHTILLVGPINNTEYKEVGLDTLPNVVFAGSKTYEQLPAYMQHMDVTLIPFLKNKLTESIYPLKINEYLAIGKPVISTDFSEDIKTFGDVIYLSNDHDTFIRQTQLALNEDNPALIQNRLDVAASNTWEARVQDFWKMVEERTGIMSPAVEA